MPQLATNNNNYIYRIQQLLSFAVDFLEEEEKLVDVFWKFDEELLVL